MDILHENAAIWVLLFVYVHRLIIYFFCWYWDYWTREFVYLFLFLLLISVNDRLNFKN